jgi:signal transduction histidine kinase
MMMEERFGPIGNPRYRQYLSDIRAAGHHIITLIDDLLDLSKIEAEKPDLHIVGLNINEIVQHCISSIQPQTNRQRVIIRTALAPGLPAVLADERALRQIVLTLLSNSINATRAGEQVIVSTAATDEGEVVLRVRDTGAGMSEKQVASALDPFRQAVTTSRPTHAGAGFGLPLTKALAEANGARFAIKSAIDAGTLVEIRFPVHYETNR